MSDEAVYRTAPATPGLLITVELQCSSQQGNCSVRYEKRIYSAIILGELQCCSVAVLKCCSVSVVQYCNVSVFQCCSVAVFHCFNIVIFPCCCVAVLQCCSGIVLQQPSQSVALAQSQCCLSRFHNNQLQSGGDSSVQFNRLIVRV